MWFFICLGSIFLIAGAVQGLTGFGAGLVAIPLLCLVLDVKIAVPLVVLNYVFITGFLCFELRSYLDVRKITPLLIGSIPGIAIGSQLLGICNPEIVRLFLGFLLVIYCGYQLFTVPRSFKMPRIVGYAAGFFTGLFTALLSAGGPPAIIYSALTDWTKDEIKATLTGFFVFNTGATVIAHAVSGLTTMLTLQYLCVTMPLVLIGTAIGHKCSARIDQAAYLKIIYILLIVMGLVMIFE